MKRTDVVAGDRYGHLTVLSETRKIIKRGTVRGVIARCDCGNERVFALSHVVSGNTSSCGCQNFRTPQVWGPSLWEEDDSGCWVWRGRLNAGGYAMFGGHVRVARKVLGEKIGRELRRGEVSRHTCDRPECVNPDHLILGTQVENLNDAVERGRKRILKEGDLCANGHVLEGTNVLVRTDSENGRIRCRACVNDAAQRYRERKRGEVKI